MPRSKHDIFGESINGGTILEIMECPKWKRQTSAIIVGNENSSALITFSVLLGNNSLIKINHQILGELPSSVKFAYNLITENRIEVYMKYDDSSSNNLGVTIISQSLYPVTSNIDWSTLTGISLT